MAMLFICCSSLGCVCVCFCYSSDGGWCFATMSCHVAKQLPQQQEKENKERASVRASKEIRDKIADRNENKIKINEKKKRQTTWLYYY